MSEEGREQWPEAIEEALGKLTDKQRAFVLAYCTTAQFNGRKAAEEAGYGGEAATPASLRAQASRTLTIVNVRQAVEALMAHLYMGPEELKARIAHDSAASMEDFLDDEQRLDLAVACERGALGHIKELTVKRGRNTDGDPWEEIKVKLVDAQAARRDLARIHGLFKDTQVHEHNLGAGWDDAVRNALGFDAQPDPDGDP